MVQLVSKGVEVTVSDEPMIVVKPNEERRFYIMTDDENSQLFHTINKPAIDDGRPYYPTLEEAFEAGGRGNATPVWMEIATKE